MIHEKLSYLTAKNKCIMWYVYIACPSVHCRFRKQLRKNRHKKHLSLWTMDFCGDIKGYKKIIMDSNHKNIFLTDR